ncbi:phage major capsid protein [Paucilactobacillus sp. N302-9]
METNTLDIRTIDNSNLAVRSADNDVGMCVQGYALLFNEPSVPMPFIEYIKPQALANVDFSNVLLLYSHKYSNILARADSGTLTTKVDSKGLFFSAQFADTSLAKDVYNDILAGNLKGCSFGFKIAENGDTWSTDKNGTPIHTITEIEDISEISITSVPAYAETSVQVERSLSDFLKGKEEKDMATEPIKDNKEVVPASEAPATSTAPKAAAPASAGIDYDKLSQAIVGAMEEVHQQREKEEEQQPLNRDDEGGDDGGDEERATDSAAPASSSATTPAPATAKASATPAAEPANTNKEGSDQPMAKVISDPTAKDKNAQVKRDFEEYLKTGNITRDAVDGGIGLSTGAVIIPETILPVEHEDYQYPRLGSLVRNVSVTTTTGKLPVMYSTDEQLALHPEFSETAASNAPEIKPINWDLKTYTGKYVYSQDLLQDSNYNWESELKSSLTELRDNTNDSLIIGKLTDGITATPATDLFTEIKHALNVALKPKDSQAASITLSQSAFNELDSMKDTMGRPLLQPDLTKSATYTILGKTVVVVPDELFPNAKVGDANIIVAPLQKAVINFKNGEITGQFQDTYDVWYKMLGIYLRQDTVQARPDLINLISSSATAPAGDTGTASK